MKKALILKRTAVIAVMLVFSLGMMLFFASAATPEEECQIVFGEYNREYAAEQGDEIRLSVNASYSTDPGDHALIYTWYKLNGPEDTVGMPIPEDAMVSADGSYTLPSDLEVGTHYYKCVVTSAHDAVVAAESEVITVTVSEADRGFFGMLLAFFEWLFKMIEAYFTIRLM